MKEATGELSITAITVVAVAAVAGIVSAFILPGLKNTITKKSQCAQAYACKPKSGSSTKIVCSYDEQNSSGTFTTKTIECDIDGGA